MTLISSSVITATREQGQKGQDTADANQCDSPKGEPLEQFSLWLSSVSVCRIPTGLTEPRQRVPDDAMITTDNHCDPDSRTDSGIASDAGSISRPHRFGRRFGRFGSVWSTSTKCKPHDSDGLIFNLVDLVDIHTGGTRARDRTRFSIQIFDAIVSAVPFPPCVKIDQIDQIEIYRRSVWRLAFGRQRPNATKRRPNSTKRRPNPDSRRLVGGRSA
jgi:hypothetical protein